MSPMQLSRSLALLKLMEILLFNFIFKNNTSSSGLHQIIHLICVCLMGGIAVAYQFVYSSIRRDNWLWQKLFWSILGGCFQLIGLAEIPSRICNFTVMLLESILIVQTI